MVHITVTGILLVLTPFSLLTSSFIPDKLNLSKGANPLEHIYYTQCSVHLELKLSTIIGFWTFSSYSTGQSSMINILKYLLSENVPLPRLGK